MSTCLTFIQLRRDVGGRRGKSGGGREEDEGKRRRCGNIGYANMELEVGTGSKCAAPRTSAAASPPLSSASLFRFEEGANAA